MQSSTKVRSSQRNLLPPPSKYKTPLYREKEGSRLIPNAATCLPNYMALLSQNIVIFFLAVQTSGIWNTEGCLRNDLECILFTKATALNENYKVS